MAAIACLLLGALLLYHGVRGTATPPPQPPPAAARPLPPAITVATSGPTASATSAPAAAPAATDAPDPLGPSVPTRIDAPRVGIHAALLSLGRNPDGTVAVPSEAQARDAAWYDGSPTPGEDGPSVILGHVDAWSLPLGRAAFYALGALRPGDEVDVTRTDRSVVVFTVDSVTVVPKDRFPTAQVYGAIDYPGLRLITCGGGFSKTNGYDGNVVVYAHMAGTRPA